jgi:hypothetical protein
MAAVPICEMIGRQDEIGSVLNVSDKPQVKTVQPIGSRNAQTEEESR